MISSPVKCDQALADSAFQAIAAALNELSGLCFLTESASPQSEQVTLFDKASQIGLKFKADRGTHFTVELSSLCKVGDKSYFLWHFDPKLKDKKTTFRSDRAVQPIAYQIFSKVLGEGEIIKAWGAALQAAQKVDERRQDLLAKTERFAELVEGDLSNSVSWMLRSDLTGFRSNPNANCEIAGQLCSDGIQLLFSGLSEGETIELINFMKQKRRNSSGVSNANSI